MYSILRMLHGLPFFHSVKSDWHLGSDFVFCLLRLFYFVHGFFWGSLLRSSSLSNNYNMLKRQSCNFWVVNLVLINAWYYYIHVHNPIGLQNNTYWYSISCFESRTQEKSCEHIFFDQAKTSKFHQINLFKLNAY